MPGGCGLTCERGRALHVRELGDIACRDCPVAFSPSAVAAPSFATTTLTTSAVAVATTAFVSATLTTSAVAAPSFAATTLTTSATTATAQSADGAVGLHQHACTHRFESYIGKMVL
jgi:hypothetical protein